MYPNQVVLVFVIPLLLKLDGSDGLDCYECLYDQTLHANCLYSPGNLTTTSCGPDERYCKVERIEIDYKLQKFQRSCTITCDDGCSGADGFHKCISCCQKDGCNVGNSSSNAVAANIWILASTLIVVSL